MLLRFRVANHRSIRDEQVLSLIAVPRRGEDRGADDVAAPPAVNVAGIFGPNASGKSSVLSAIRFFVNAVRNSYRLWDPVRMIPCEPFLLSAKSVREPSFFELDFVFGGIRHTYGFELDRHRVLGEWLHTYPHGKRRVLYDREIQREKNEETGGFYFGRTLRGENSIIVKLTRPNALFLSTAASASHPILTPIFTYITRNIAYADSTSNQEAARLEWLKQELKDPEFARDITDMLRLADLGLTGVRVVSDPPMSAKRRSGGQEVRFRVDVSSSGEVVHELPHNELGEIFGTSLPDAFTWDSERIELSHSSAESADGIPIPLEKESSGTRAWLSFAGRILYALRYGRALVVDEIDSSLHPMLSATLIHIFKDEEFNRHGAQLVFTTHDVSYLGNLVDEKLLARDEVWFTEKDDTGATTLYSLEDFKTRPVENVERGYLLGRYGALPIIDVEQIKCVLGRVVRREEASSGD